MKVLFICSSLEPTQDGVGDYTRMLAACLNENTFETSIIAINDRRLKDDNWKGKQIANNSHVEVLRLSSKLSWKEKLKQSATFIKAFNPEWISLQFVPFGYQIKGLPFNLGTKLKRLSNNVHWHVMFHELSVNKNESFKFRIWSYLQEQIMKSLMQSLKPALITTNTEVYKYSLKKLGISSSVLPLFSNIEIKKTDETYKNQIALYLPGERSSYFIGTLFGNFSYKSWNLTSLLDKLQNQFPDKKKLIVSIGKMSSGKAYWEKLTNKYPSINFLTLGMQDATFLSHWFSFNTDFGILATLPELSGKSGSFMAFKEHGVPVVCKEPEGELKSYNIQLDSYLRVIPDKSISISFPGKLKPVSLLTETVKQFIRLLIINY